MRSTYLLYDRPVEQYQNRAYAQDDEHTDHTHADVCGGSDLLILADIQLISIRRCLDLGERIESRSYIKVLW